MKVRWCGALVCKYAPLVCLPMLGVSSSACVREPITLHAAEEAEPGAPVFAATNTTVSALDLDASGVYQAVTTFSITNRSSANVEISEVIIDLRSTTARALFGTQARASGVDYLRQSFDDFAPGQTFDVRVDVDQLLGSTYTALCLTSCLEGARIVVVFSGPSLDPTPLATTYGRTSLSAGP
jgi:hypothetical protein